MAPRNSGANFRANAFSGRSSRARHYDLPLSSANRRRFRRATMLRLNRARCRLQPWATPPFRLKFFNVAEPACAAEPHRSKFSKDVAFQACATPPRVFHGEERYQRTPRAVNLPLAGSRANDLDRVDVRCHLHNTREKAHHGTANGVFWRVLTARVWQFFTGYPQVSLDGFTKRGND
jgi:hypothetical protein